MLAVSFLEFEAQHLTVRYRVEDVLFLICAKTVLSKSCILEPV